LAPSLVVAQTFSSGSTGADLAFAPTGNTTLTLPATGVFNYTTINIPAGVTVTFTKNTANTPVILLARENVTIAGTVNVSGSGGLPFGRPGRGGPGGFDGGAGADYPTTSAGGVGLGPGGGGIAANTHGGGGGHATTGPNGACNSGLYSGCGPTVFAPGGVAYGSNTLRPIIGGSGGGGGYSDSGYGGGGGGGGGALLIASSGTLTVTGSILAEGAGGGSGRNSGGPGAGGAIRLIANTITGTGPTLRAVGGGTGGEGRIRLEAYTLTVSWGGYSGGQITPSPSNAYPQPVFPPTGQPSLAITSVAGVAAPAAPKGTFLDPPDVVLPTGTASPVEVGLTASNIPLGTVIQVTATPQSGSKVTANSTGLSGSLASATATASLSLSLSQTSILTATATYPLVASAGSGPLYAEGPVPSPAGGGIEGEEVTHVRVAAVFGGGSSVTYLTRSGREVALP
jgi:hypothetical protein